MIMVSEVYIYTVISPVKTAIFKWKNDINFSKNYRIFIHF
jgi:hypothetical protein